MRQPLSTRKPECDYLMADHHDDSFNSLIATANGLVAKPDLHPRLQQKENQQKYYLLLNSGWFWKPSRRGGRRVLKGSQKITHIHSSYKYSAVFATILLEYLTTIFIKTILHILAREKTNTIPHHYQEAWVACHFHSTASTVPGIWDHFHSNTRQSQFSVQC